MSDFVRTLNRYSNNDLRGMTLREVFEFYEVFHGTTGELWTSEMTPVTHRYAHALDEIDALRDRVYESNLLWIEPYPSFLKAGLSIIWSEPDFIFKIHYIADLEGYRSSSYVFREPGGKSRESKLHLSSTASGYNVETFLNVYRFGRTCIEGGSGKW